MYYCPGAAGSVDQLRESFARAGCGFADKLGLPGMCGSGPDGGAGAFAALACLKESATPLATYRPAAQTWRETCGGRLWIGWETDRPPTPADLERRGAAGVLSHPVALGDGHTWRVPVVRRPRYGSREGTPGWPSRLAVQFNPQGEPVGLEHQVREDFSELWSLTRRIWDVYIGAGDDVDVCDDMTLVHYCAKVLGLRYWIDLAECDVFALFSPDNLREVIDAALDGPSLRALAREMDLAGASAGDGEKKSAGTG